MLTAHGTSIPIAIATPSTSTITEARNELRTGAAAGRCRRYRWRAAYHRPGSLGADHADRPATGLVQIRNGAGRASGRDRTRPLDTAHRVSRVAGGGRFRAALRPHRRHGLEPRTHCLWRLVCNLRMARSADAWRARAQS